jgi:metallophosphoesterase (TIGR03767 family)
MRRLVLLVALLALTVADAAADTTFDRTIQPIDAGPYVPLGDGMGDRHKLRREPGVAVRPGRAARRRSLVRFAQLTDPQIADEMSPARVDLADPAGGEIRSAWRPMEVMGLQIFDATVRAVNAQPGVQFVLATGDLADNQQLNETRWFKTVLDGGPVDPFSGKPIGPGNECPGASAEEIARINGDVAARRYTGIADYDDYRDSPDDRKSGFWDPDEAPPGGAGPYAAFPRYPNLLERAQAPFVAAGLDAPWYVARGNHDGLIQGNAPASEELFRAIAVGCLKVFPSAAFDSADYRGVSDEELFSRFATPEFISTLLAGARRVAPDPDRRIVSKREYREEIGGHGFEHTPAAQLEASRGTAAYYAFTPRPGLRFIALDTVAEGGGDDGNLDHPQYRWLERRLRRATRRGQLVVVYGHHTLATMDNERHDERAGSCETPDEPGCDRDPRRSRPLHLGLDGPKPVERLFRRHDVIAYVAGHTHANRVRSFGSFWEINTASHIDWPQQARVIEVMDNRDGTLSIFGTLIDHAAPVAAPPPGDATAFSVDDLAALGRVLAFNDPQRQAGKAGADRDRNVELLVRDPRVAVARCASC